MSAAAAYPRPSRPVAKAPAAVAATPAAWSTSPLPVASSGAALLHQAARAQMLLDRIAHVSEVPVGASDDPATLEGLLKALDARDAILADLQPVVAELSTVRGQLAGDGALAAQARALDLALAPVEQAARRAIGFHEQLVEKMQAMRDELVWEMDRLGRLGAVANGYLGEPAAAAAGAAPARRLDVRR